MSDATTPDVRVVDNHDEARFEAYIGDELAGAAYYDLADDGITFVHTEVEDKFEGHGVGGKLAKFALDDARARGLKLTAECPFIASYIERHPEYHDLLA